MRKLRKPKGPFEDDEFGPYYLLPLTKGKSAKVSPEDIEAISKNLWYASKESRGTKWYAIRWIMLDGKKTKLRMHRVILGLPPGREYNCEQVVDHIGHDGLDNRRTRLEVISQDENMRRSEGWTEHWKSKPEEPAL